MDSVAADGIELYQKAPTAPAVPVTSVTSVRDLVLLGDPLVERLHGLLPQELLHRKAAAGTGTGDFAIEELVVESRPGGILPGTGEVDPGDPRPVGRGQAHRTGLATRIEHAPVEVERPEFAAGLADGHDLGVGGGVVGPGDLVPAPSDDLSLVDDDRPERSAFVPAHLLSGKADRLPHELGFHGPFLPAGSVPLPGTRGNEGGSKRPSSLLWLFVVFGSLLQASCGMPGPKLVLLLVVDTLRADRLGCYGYEEIETPHIDDLARHGVRYEKAVSAVPVTLPSMSTILTGTYPVQHGIRDNGPYRLGDSWNTLGELLRGAGFATGAFVSAAVLDPVHNLTQGFDVYDADVSMPYNAYDPLLASTEDDIQGIERRAQVTVDRALEWLRGHREGDAFLLVHLFDPHLPRDPPPPFRDLYRDRPYEGEIAYTDQEIGRLLDGIGDIWHGGDITTVFVADHGEGLGDHGEWLHGDLLHEATMHVPLIVAGPGLPQDEAVPDLVRTADVLPTICALVGAQIPSASVGQIVGQILPGLGLEPRSAGDLPPRLSSTAYIETFRPRLTHRWCELRGIRTERWKLIDGPEYELYDLTADPGENSDLAAKQPALRDSLAQLLDRVAFLVAKRGVNRADDFEMTEDQVAKFASLGYITPRRSQIPETGGVSGLSADSLAIWLYPPNERGRALDLPHPREHVAAAQDRIIAHSFYKSAVAELEAGNGAEAARRFRMAFEKNPEYADAYLGFVDAAMAEGQKDAALQCLQIAQESLPADDEIAARLAGLLLQKGRKVEALRVLARAERAGAPDSLLVVIREKIEEAEE